MSFVLLEFQGGEISLRGGGRPPFAPLNEALVGEEKEEGKGKKNGRILKTNCSNLCSVTSQSLFKDHLFKRPLRSGPYVV